MRLQNLPEAGITTAEQLAILKEQRRILLGLRCEVALIMMERAIRAYNPNQPRVPAGHGEESGRWTSEGGFALPRPRYDPGRRVEGERVAGRNRAIGRLVRIGDAWHVASPGQSARLDAAQFQANQAVRNAQRLDPNWRPGPSVSARTVEGEIARIEGIARQADMHFATIMGREPPASVALRDLLQPRGRTFGEALNRKEPGVRTVTQSDFAELVASVTRYAQPVPTPATYDGQWFQRRDGSIVGLRYSVGSGLTIDVLQANSPSLLMKVHSR